MWPDEPPRPIFDLTFSDLVDENERLRRIHADDHDEQLLLREMLSVALEQLVALTTKMQEQSRVIARLRGQPLADPNVRLEPWYPPADSPPLPPAMVTAEEIRWEAE